MMVERRPIYASNGYKAILASIKAEPGDDAPRLAMADFLEEAGETDRAALIRVQLKAQEYPGDAEYRRLVRETFKTFEAPITGGGTVKVLANRMGVKYRWNGKYFRAVLDRGFVCRIDGIVFPRFWLDEHEAITAQTPIESIGLVNFLHPIYLPGHGWRLAARGFRYHKDTDHLEGGVLENAMRALRILLPRHWPKIRFDGPGLGERR